MTRSGLDGEIAVRAFLFRPSVASLPHERRDEPRSHRPIMLKPEKVPPEERPHGWQYPAGVIIILLMAAVAWLLLR